MVAISIEQFANWLASKKMKDTAAPDVVLKELKQAGILKPDDDINSTISEDQIRIYLRKHHVAAAKQPSKVTLQRKKRNVVSQGKGRSG